VSPSPFVLEHLALAPPGPALDVACGSGRHALALARAGRVVDAVDRDPARCAALARQARADGLAVRVVCADLTDWSPPHGRYAIVVNTLYLERALVPRLVAGLAPGGLLLFETFTAAQLATGHPRNPDFVLHPGELARLAIGLEVLAHREGAVERDGATVHLAALAARRVAGPPIGG
jgi:protein-L-isoaspartate O-methyltransferase